MIRREGDLMKRGILCKILILVLIIMMISTLFACGKKKDPGEDLIGTWYYVNGNDKTTRVFITFRDNDEMKIGLEDSGLSVNTEEWNELLSGIFGDITDLINKTGINLDITAEDIAETLSGLLALTYEVKSDEEVRITVTALKLISIHHTSQYSFKKNGDLVLNGIVFRKK